MNKIGAFMKKNVILLILIIAVLLAGFSYLWKWSLCAAVKPIFYLEYSTDEMKWDTVYLDIHTSEGGMVNDTV